MFVCGIFIDPEKTFDTVDHSILVYKHHSYRTKDLVNNWFSSYLSSRRKFFSINGFSSTTQGLGYRVPQGPVLSILLFLICINDLHNAIKFSQPLQFRDDLCLLNIQSQISKIKKVFIKNFFRANNIALNIVKTEVLFLKTNHKPSDTELKLKLYRKTLDKTNYVGYFGICIDDDLSWNAYVHCFASKLNKVNTVLSKLRHFVGSENLRTVYFAIFQSHIHDVCATWGLISYPKLK